MAMTRAELERALRSLRLSGMIETLSVRTMEVDNQAMTFTEAFGWLVQDELDRRRTRLIGRRFSLSGLKERKSLKEFEWGFNPKIPKREIMELGTLKFVDAKQDALFIGQPGTGKSHIAKALALLGVERGYKVCFREARELLEELHEARQLGTLKKLRAALIATQLLVIDDLFLSRVPVGPGEDLVDLLMSRYEKGSTIITSNRVIEDWSNLLGDVVLVTPLLDRLMHHGHLFRFEGKSWRMKEGSERMKGGNAEPL